MNIEFNKQPESKQAVQHCKTDGDWITKSVIHEQLLERSSLPRSREEVKIRELPSAALDKSDNKGNNNQGDSNAYNADAKGANRSGQISESGLSCGDHGCRLSAQCGMGGGG